MYGLSFAYIHCHNTDTKGTFTLAVSSSTLVLLLKYADTKGTFTLAVSSNTLVSPLKSRDEKVRGSNNHIYSLCHIDHKRNDRA